MTPQPPEPAPAPAPATPPQQEEPSPQAINAEVEPEAPSAASPTASAKGSPQAESPFIDEAGPAFDPEVAEPGPELESEEPEPFEEIEWTEESLRRWLLLQGELTHGVIGVAEIDWKHTEADLVSIAGPLSRILNRYDTTRAIAAYDDPLSVAFGVGMYTIRSVGERRRVLAAQAAEEQPITGVPAPPGSGPPPPAPAPAGPMPPAPPAPPAPPGQPLPDGVNPAEIDWQLGH